MLPKKSWEIKTSFHFLLRMFSVAQSQFKDLEVVIKFKVPFINWEFVFCFSIFYVFSFSNLIDDYDRVLGIELILALGDRMVA